LAKSESKLIKINSPFLDLHELGIRQFGRVVRRLFPQNVFPIRPYKNIRGIGAGKVHMREDVQWPMEAKGKCAKLSKIN
jgi:hypothetical protein